MTGESLSVQKRALSKIRPSSLGEAMIGEEAARKTALLFGYDNLPA